MYTFLYIVHIIISFLLIIFVLLQVSRGASMSSFLGGGGESLIGSPSGSKSLKRIIVILAILFVITSLSLTLITSRQQGISSLMLSPEAQTQTSPVSPAPSEEAEEIPTDVLPE